MDSFSKALQRLPVAAGSYGDGAVAAVAAPSSGVRAVPALTGFAYLASPYSHQWSSIREMRAITCNVYMTALATRGVIVYSPIWHWHHSAVRYDLPTDASWWRDNNLRFMEAASAVIVAEMPGWRVSKGIAMELAWAVSNGCPVYYCHETNGFDLTTCPTT